MDITSLKECNYTPSRTEKVVEEMTIELDSHSQTRIESHYRAFERVWMKNSLTSDFSLKEFQDYIEMCFYLRIVQQTSSLKEYTKVSKRMKIPSLIFLILEQIGYVECKDFGIVIIPKMDEPKNKKTVSELNEMSIKLQELEDLGVEMAQGIPSSNEGSVDFMFMQVIDDVMKTNLPGSHPVYAMLKSFIKCSTLQSVLNPRIYFPSREEYTLQYNSLIRSRHD